jgi:lysophospholipase L1-like esterase
MNADGTISKEIMNDYLHLTEKGYQIWAEALDQPLKEMMQ